MSPVFYRCIYLLLILLTSTHSFAQEIKLPLVFTDHMVLQQGVKAPIWGWSTPSSQVTIKFKGQTLKAISNTNGKWQTAFEPLKVSNEPATMTLSNGTHRIELSDILVGEVWLCSGQSNMERIVSRCMNAKEEITNSNHPLIRHIKVPKNNQMFPQDQLKKTQWTVCSPQTVGDYTAVGYYFARRLQQELNIPIGLIHSSWGGSRITPWIPRVGFKQVNELQDTYNELMVKDPSTDAYKTLAGSYLTDVKNWLAHSRKNVAKRTILSQPPAYPKQIMPYTRHAPTTLYNGMIAPLVPYAIKGSLWYQGEADHRGGMIYLQKSRALIEGWRTAWENKDMPFYYVQIAPYRYGKENPQLLAEFWGVQAQIEKQIPNTGMVIISDVGNIKDIHPSNKQDVGLRLANMALAKDYGKTDLVYHSPTFKNMKHENNKIILTFDHVGSGLASRDGSPLNEFQIASQEQTWTDATANITGKDTVEVFAQDVSNPVAIRFAYHKTATPNLMNKEGLPAQTFIAGDVPKWDNLSQNVEESVNYKLLYDMDLTKLDDAVKYDINYSSDSPEKIKRIAYYLEIGNDPQKLKWVYVSMDAFTNDAKKIGIPKYGLQAQFQKNASNMNIYSNVTELVTGKKIDGFIEFSPGNYSKGNIAKVPGARDDAYDMGDDLGRYTKGYGCMQVHNLKDKQTVFALNHWSQGNNADLGIGNNNHKNSDWTFSRTAKHYKIKRLRVLVLADN